MRFDDQVVVVTGGTRGIGAGIAAAFHGAGARVAVTYVSDETAAAAFRDRHPGAAARRCDTASAADVEAFYGWLDDRFGRVDVLVNNAGIRRDAIVGMLAEADWDRVVDVNLKGTFLMSKGAVQRMSRKRYGRIVSITSPSGRLGFPGQGSYAASKAGQVGLTRALAREVARRNITVNCVSPGFIETDLLKDLEDAAKERYRGMIPLERFGKVEEVAAAVLFLASPAASYVTGSVLDVTGGL